MTTKVKVKGILRLKKNSRVSRHTRKIQGHLCTLSLFFRDLCGRLMIHFKFEIPIKI